MEVKRKNAKNRIAKITIRNCWLDGVSKMTIVFATLMVSIGIPGRDSKMCG